MLGRLHPTSREAHIIGAGSGGLLAAYYLLQAGYTITLYDQSNASGGLIATQHKPWGIVETAAHSLRTNQELVDLCTQLNVPLEYAKTKKKYIYRNDKMRAFPLSFIETLGMLRRALFVRAIDDNLTLAAWGTRHLGQAAVDNLLTPLAHGIYGASPHQLLAGDAFKRLAIPAGKTLIAHVWTRNKAKNAHKMRMAAPQNGMGQLMQALHAYIAAHPKATLKLGAPITALPTADNVILAVPAHAAGTLLNAADSTLANALRAVPYTPLITATVCLRTGTFTSHESIGVLHAAFSGLNSLGILFNSSTFDKRVTGPDFASFTVMLGATHMDKSDAALLDLITDDLRQLLQLQSPPHDIAITRWPQAIPLYGRALHTVLHGKWDWLSQPGHILAGNYAGEVSLRGMIADSAALAKH